MTKKGPETRLEPWCQWCGAGGAAGGGGGEVVVMMVGGDGGGGDGGSDGGMLMEGPETRRISGPVK